MSDTHPIDKFIRSVAGCIDANAPNPDIAHAAKEGFLAGIGRHERARMTVGRVISADDKRLRRRTKAA